MLNYSVIGKSHQNTVLFLHGAGVNSWMWRDVLVYLPDDIQVILIDLPGHGGNADKAWTNLADVANQINQITHQQINEIHLVGLSLGAYVAFEAIKQAPLLYKSALLSGMHAPPMPNKTLMKLITPTMSKLFTTRFFAKKNAKMLGCRTEDLEQFIESAVNADSKSISSATFDVINFCLPNKLTSVTTQTLFVAGDKEHATIISSVPILAKSIPKAKSQLIRNAGHAWSGEHPDLFASLILKQVISSTLSE